MYDFVHQPVYPPMLRIIISARESACTRELRHKRAVFWIAIRQNDQRGMPQLLISCRAIISANCLVLLSVELAERQVVGMSSALHFPFPTMQVELQFAAKLCYQITVIDPRR